MGGRSTLPTDRLRRRAGAARERQPGHDRPAVVAGWEANYGRMVKPERGGRSPIHYETLSGNAGKPGTSYVERANLSIRMENRRFARKTNAHS